MNRTKQLELDVLMYANVAGRFAFFQNKKYRGEKVGWSWFVDNCVSNVDLWFMVRYGKNPTKEQLDYMKQVAKDIAETLIWHLEDNDELPT